MRQRSELDAIKNFVDTAYSSFRNVLIVNDEKVYDPRNPELGYCYKHVDSNTGNVIYKIVTSRIEIDRTDFRVLMHEYGHIYLGHMDGLHEELDSKICRVFDTHRGQLIDRINKECGIDFADKLIERVIDDPVLNHSLHNIAMDMEVNSAVLSTPDIEEMEMDITTVLPKDEEELLKYMADNCEDPSIKKELEDQLKKMQSEAKIKLIVPERYYTSVDQNNPDNNIPFPTDLTYPEYLIMIIKHLDQFVKMLVSIKNGGNGDTSQVSSQDVQDALSGQGEGGEGQGSPSMQGLDDLLESMGLSDGQGQGNDSNQNSQSGEGSGEGGKDKSESPYKGQRDSGTDELNGDKNSPGGTHKDHRSDERDDADKKRELGQITSKGSQGCGSGRGAGATREVTNQDPIDMGLEDVIRNFKSKVVSYNTKKDITYTYNRGINRTVIAPRIKQKVMVTTNPTIVFLIDISGSMDTELVDRILKTISNKMKKINRGLKYNIISWNTHLEEHIKDIDPRRKVPRISMGGGTRMAKGIDYFKKNYNSDAILIIISDFEDYLEEWHAVEKTMSGYSLYGFNYGYRENSQPFKYLKVKECVKR